MENCYEPNKSIKGNARPHQHELVTKLYAANVTHAQDGFAIVSWAFINQMVRVRMAGPLICERWVEGRMKLLHCNSNLNRVYQPTDNDSCLQSKINGNTQIEGTIH